MAGSLTASLTLTLADKLTPGLAAVGKQLDALGKQGKALGLGKLETAVDPLKKAAVQAKMLANEIWGVEKKISATSDAMTRFGQDGRGEMRRTAREAKALADEIWGVQKNAGRAESSLHRMRIGGAGGFGKAAKDIGAFGAAGAGLSVAEPIREYAGFENTLRHIAITEKLTGPAIESEVARLTKLINEDAVLTGNSGTQVAAAYSDLVQSGIPAKEVDRLIPIHSRAATAYNISPESMGQAVYALSTGFKIPASEMEGSLSSMALSAKEGKFKVEDYSHFLPMIGARMQKLGMTGRGSADKAFAALEVVRQSSADAGTAATNFGDFLQYITSPIAVRSFKKGGIDLPGLLNNAGKKGIDPIDAVIQKLSDRVKGKTPVEAALELGKMLHNQQAGDAALALIQHKDEYIKLRQQLGQSNPETFHNDYENARRSPQKALDETTERLSQFTRILGEGFSPLLGTMNGQLTAVDSALRSLDEKFPGLRNNVLLAGGGLLAFIAVVGVLGFTVPLVGAGFTALGSVLTAVIGTAGGATAALWRLDAAMSGLSAGLMKNPLFRVATLGMNLYDTATKGREVAPPRNVNDQPFSWYNPGSWLHNNGQPGAAVPGAAVPGAPVPTPDAPGRRPSNSDFTSPAVPMAPAPAQLNGNITISVDAMGTPTVSSYSFDQPGVTATAPDRGKVLDRH